MIEADRLFPGRIAASSDEITTADLAHPEVDGDLGEIVPKKLGGVILVLTDPSS